MTHLKDNHCLRINEDDNLKRKIENASQKTEGNKIFIFNKHPMLLEWHFRIIHGSQTMELYPPQYSKTKHLSTRLKIRLMHEAEGVVLARYCLAVIVEL